MTDIDDSAALKKQLRAEAVRRRDALPAAERQAAAETIAAREAAMAKALLTGTPAGDVMGGNYEHMLEKDAS